VDLVVQVVEPQHWRIVVERGRRLSEQWEGVVLGFVVRVVLAYVLANLEVVG